MAINPMAAVTMIKAAIAAYSSSIGSPLERL
jgi:hypothetical protein